MELYPKIILLAAKKHLELLDWVAKSFIDPKNVPMILDKKTLTRQSDKHKTS